jgi:c-di-AMP phosphodiesterase-like protein
MVKSMTAKKVWHFAPILSTSAAVVFAMAAVSFFWDYRIALCELAAGAALVVFLYFRLRRVQKDIRSIVLSTMEDVDYENHQSLINFPLPAVITGQAGDIVWYNDLFRDSVLGGIDSLGTDIRTLSRSINPHAFDKQGTAVDVNIQNHRYTLVGEPSQRGFYIIYWIENTELKNIADEYHDSRPVVAVVMVDNYDELMQNAREGEKGEIVNQIEKSLLAWVSQSSGFIRHSDRDKYVFVFEERHLRKYIEARFDILDKVRQIVAGERMPATLSIGVGRGGRSFAETEEMARQALDMALGRGGDQAAVRSPAGFEFYGGVSKAVEKRTKVKTRIIASALTELIDGSGNVLIMGHRNADLDSLGSSVGLYRAVISRGRQAQIVINTQNTFVQQTVNMLKENGYSDAFSELGDAMQLVTRRTLLIVVDTHRKGYIEFPELYETVRTIAVIDHHRKMVDFIDNAVIFYHEPYASSASEMVSELIQYVSDNSIGPLEAGMLMAGMQLDTRNFTVRTGVRTFEAAAYLRRKGADTARVRQMFSGSMENYVKRSRLVASAERYKSCAIAVYDGPQDPDIKIVVPQAADDLLTITGVNASFVMFQDGDRVSVSARSFGAVNVQLIMEKLGGGGHLAMAGAQLVSHSQAEVKEKLKDAIDTYFKENE